MQSFSKAAKPWARCTLYKASTLRVIYHDTVGPIKQDCVIFKVPWQCRIAC